MEYQTSLTHSLSNVCVLCSVAKQTFFTLHVVINAYTWPAYNFNTDTCPLDAPRRCPKMLALYLLGKHLSHLADSSQPGFFLAQLMLLAAACRAETAQQLPKMGQKWRAGATHSPITATSGKPCAGAQATHQERCLQPSTPGATQAALQPLLCSCGRCCSAVPASPA